MMAEASLPSKRAALLERVAALVEPMQRNADALDTAGAFPADDIAMLRDAGVLAAPIPARLGGEGLGTDWEGADAVARLLQVLGRASIAVGRIIEAHINAVRLLARYGAPEQLGAACDAARDGALFALWVTDPPDAPGLALETSGAGWRLSGGKAFCSAAGHATYVVLTAVQPCERGPATRLLVLRLGAGERVGPLSASMQGVRAACTGRVDFDGLAAPAGAVFGADGDYLREPDFSGGAWRGSAVAAGGLAALVEAMRQQLGARGRLDEPLQRARFGHALIACRTARLWVEAVAQVAEDPDGDAGEIAAQVNLARIAVEAACLHGLELVQRSLGLQAFLRGNPVERMARDLATYLRQPAPDAALHEAAGHFAAHPKTCA